MRSNYSREERQKIVEEYIQSGKSQTVFAPEYGIKPNTLSAWLDNFLQSFKRNGKSHTLLFLYGIYYNSRNQGLGISFMLNIVIWM